MSLYKKYKKEIRTLHLISQIIGKVKLEYAVQEPQWAHTMLDITTRGFTTGLLKYEDSYFDIEVDLLKSVIMIRKDDKKMEIMLEDGKSVSQYYNELISSLHDLGLPLSIQTYPQEMEWKVAFEDDTFNDRYSQDASREILKWFQFAWDAQLLFIGPIRQRKVYPGLFWGTFDVSSIIIYNKSEAFPDDSKIIERAAFDEHMIEFGFWLGDDNFEYPTFFILPYPFVDSVELEVDDTFPPGSYFSSKMAEYLYEIKDNINDVKTSQVIEFMSASNKKAMEYLQWENTNHFFKELKMEKNKK